jgi:8-oxo-dGTP pyrophosphatase MutT (NUDIX family)
MQVGGHGDEGETDLLAIARREAEEETGLVDLVSYPRREPPEIVQVAVVDVPASATEAAHQHGDVRYLFATRSPERIREESPDAPLRWCDESAALELVSEENLRTFILRACRALDETEGDATRSD